MSEQDLARRLVDRATELIDGPAAKAECDPHHFVWTWPIEGGDGAVGVCDLCGAVTTGERDAKILANAAAALVVEPIPNGLWGQPNKKAWFCEGARWSADFLRSRSQMTGTPSHHADRHAEFTRCAPPGKHEAPAQPSVED
jgi:hypothetical protein